MAAEGQHFVTIVCFLYVSAFWVDVWTIFRPAESTHIAAEGCQTLNLAKLGLAAAAEKRVRFFFAEMSVSRRRRARFHKMRRTLFFCLGTPLGMILPLFATKMNENAAWKSAVSGDTF